MRVAVHINPFAAMRLMFNDQPSGDPDPVLAAVVLDVAGVDGIVCRANDKRAPLSERDLTLLKQIGRRHLTVESEVNETALRKIMEMKPDQVTLLPTENTPKNQGLEVEANAAELKEIISSLHAAQIETCVFIEPVIAQVKAARKVQADYVTLNTYALTHSPSTAETIIHLEEIESASLGANKLELRVLASGGLNYRNVGNLVTLGTIEELVLGYEFISHAVFVGLERALQEVRQALNRT